MSSNEERTKLVSSLVEDFAHATEIPDSVYLLDDIPTKKLKNARQSHDVDIHTPVLMLIDRTLFGGAKDSTLITPYYISFKDLWEDSYYYPWDVITEVGVIEGDIVFYFEDGTFPDEDYIAFEPSKFIFGDEFSGSYAEHIPILLNNISTRCVNQEQQLLQEQVEKIREAMGARQWNVAVEALDFLEEAGLIDDRWFIYRALAYEELGDYDLAERDISKYHELLSYLKDENEELLGVEGQTDYAYAYGKKLLRDGEPAQAAALLDYFRKKLEEDESRPEMVTLRKTAKDLLTEVDQKLAAQLETHVEEKNRVLYVYEDYPSPFDLPEDVLPVRRNAVRDELVFPAGHPKSNAAYVRHPYRKDVFYAYHDYEYEIFRDKLYELSHVLQSLGAREIVVESKHDVSSSVKSHLEEDLKTNARYKLVGAEGEISEEKEKSAREGKSDRYLWSQKFEPVGPPSLPGEDELTWYRHERGWQRMAQQRKSGALSEYTLRITRKETSFFSESRKEKIEGELNALIISTGGSLSTESSSVRSEQEMSSWNVQVKFYSLDELDEDSDDSSGIPDQSSSTTPESNGTEFNADEEEYIEILETCLGDDNEFSSEGLRLASRWRQRLAISESRAEELQSLVVKQSQLSPEEQEYMEELEFCRENSDELSKVERRLLDRLAKQLGLTSKQIEELEKR